MIDVSVIEKYNNVIDKYRTRLTRHLSNDVSLALLRFTLEKQAFACEKQVFKFIFEAAQHINAEYVCFGLTGVSFMFSSNKTNYTKEYSDHLILKFKEHNYRDIQICCVKSEQYLSINLTQQTIVDNDTFLTLTSDMYGVYNVAKYTRIAVKRADIISFFYSKGYLTQPGKAPLQAKRDYSVKYITNAIEFINTVKHFNASTWRNAAIRDIINNTKNMRWPQYNLFMSTLDQLM